MQTIGVALVATLLLVAAPTQTSASIETPIRVYDSLHTSLLRSGNFKALEQHVANSLQLDQKPETTYNITKQGGVTG